MCFDSYSIICIEALMLQYPTICQYYSFIRKKVNGNYGIGDLSVKSREQVAKVAPLMDIIWYYEELQCPYDISLC